MRLCVSLLVIPFFLLVATRLAAGHSPDPTRARLEASARVAALAQSDFGVLSSQAESGDQEAQYWRDGSYAKDHMTPSEILDAERMANEWKSRHSTP